jgi:uncharacterized membrane protein YfcA
MLVKIVTLFLIAMAVLAMFGRLKMPRIGRKKETRLQGRKSCPRCGRFLIGKGDCDCKLPPKDEV